MEIKLPGTEDKEQQYYDSLLARIREIRASEKTPKQKAADIVKCASNYEREDANVLKSMLCTRMTLLSYNGEARFINCLIMLIERMVELHQPLTIESIEEQSRICLDNTKGNLDIYEYPSFSGIFKDDEDGGIVTLPKELENFNGGSMILKIEDMDRFIDTFCSRDTYYRRAYAILADLDKEVLESLETGEFNEWVSVSYKDFGDAIFEFSHFEVDLREPDSQFRTLYVVYRYDTSAS